MTTSETEAGNSADPETARKGCLSHIKVLDMSRVFAGPWAAQLLADFGADVIKVEQPGRGDDARRLPPFINDLDGNQTRESAAFLSFNRNKRSMTIDYTKPEGRELVYTLARQADVFIENFKAGGLVRHGLDYETLRKINPRLIYCSITGFGQSGPYSPRPGYDMIFQAMSGLMSITGEPDGMPGGGPMKVGYSATDVSTGTAAALAIMGALMHRDVGGGAGQHIDIALLDMQIASLSHMAMAYLITGNVPARLGNVSYTGAPVQTFDCQDIPIVVSVGNDIQWERFCKAADRMDLLDDPRFSTNIVRISNRLDLIPLLIPMFRQRKAAEWVDLLEKAGVPAGPVYNLDQVFADEHVQQRGMLREMAHPVRGTVPTLANPINMSESPVVYDRPPPLQGEHTDEVLARDLGMSADQIAALRAADVI